MKHIEDIDGKIILIFASVVLLVVALINFDAIKAKLPNLTIQLIIIGAILFVLVLIMIHTGGFFEHMYGEMVILGVVILLAGFALLFTTIPSNLILNEDDTIFHAYNLCNSFLGEATQLLEDPKEELREACQIVNMLFFLGILLGILGIILFVVGLVKKKEHPPTSNKNGT